MRISYKTMLWIFAVIAVFACIGIYWIYRNITDSQRLYFLTHDGDVTAVAFSPDGERLATANSGEKCTISIWNAKNGDFVESLSVCPVPYPFPYEVSFCDISYRLDGQQIAVKTCGYGVLWIIDLNTGGIVRELQGLPQVSSVDFSPDGKLVLVSNGQLRDIATGDEVLRLVGHDLGIYRTIFSADGQLIATASADGTARLWEASSGNELMRFIGHQWPVNDVEFGSNNNTLFTASYDGTVRQWDVETGAEIKRFGLSGEILRYVFYIPHQEKIVVVGQYSDVWVFDVETQKKLTHFKPGPGARLTTAEISPDGSKLALANEHEVSVWDIAE